ncbi:MAG: type II secretion system F family protein [Chloroflexi bacterium]|nr:type II secretion system F family protein [Chloroflexota bacterium]MBI3732206.1 type II secretion system F family protein [Chloroflexota bacterium]
MIAPLLIAMGLGAAVVMVFVGLAVRRTASPVQARLNQFGSRIRTLEEIELETPFSERVVKPLLQSAAHMVLRFAPRSNLEALRHKLDMAGNPNGWTPSDFLGVRGLAAIVCGLVPTILMLVARAPFAQLVLFSVGGGLIGFFLPVFWLGNKAKARQKEMQKALPDALDLLTISVEAGLALDAGMAKVAEKASNELSRAFARVLSEVRMGRPRREALRDMADRAGVADLTTFTTAIIQAEQLGVSMTKVLRIQSEQMRIKRRQRAEEEAHNAPTKISIVLVLLLLPGLCAVLIGPSVPRLCRQFKVSDLCG